jgi:hypothetical protein
MPVGSIPPASAFLPLRREHSDLEFKTDTSPDAIQRRTSAPARLQPNSGTINGNVRSKPVERLSAAESTARLENFKQLQLKRAGQPYVPTKGDSAVNHNQVVDLPDEAADNLDETLVLCRHFATMFAKDPAKKRALLEQFRTETGIAAVFAGKLAQTETDSESIPTNAPQHAKHLVSEQQFGRYVGAIAQTLAAGGDPASVNVLLYTDGHAMALHVERKVKDGQRSYNAKVFDPNNTGNYKRIDIKTQTPEALAHLKFQDFLIDPDIEGYAMAGEPLTLAAVVVEDSFNLQLPQLHFSATAEADQLPSKSELHMAMTIGTRGAIATMADRLVGHAGYLPEGELFELLAAKADDGVPALAMAMQEGDTQTMQSFVDLLSRMSLPVAALVPLLAATNGEGVSGLHIAMEDGHANAVGTFASALNQLGLPSEAKTELMNARRADRVTGLYVAMAYGKTNTVAAFAQALGTLGLNREQQFDLIAAKDPKDRPAVLIALTKQQYESAAAGFDMFTALDVDPQHALDLLLPYQGLPALTDRARDCIDQFITTQQVRLHQMSAVTTSDS